MEKSSPSANIVKPALTVKTIQQADGHFRTDWQTSDRRGYVLTQPPAGSYRLAVAELLGLHAVTGLIRPLRIRDFERKAAICISVPAIKEILSGVITQTYLEPFIRFLALSLSDLPVEVNSNLVGWADHPSEHLESLELARNDPWDDPVHLPDGLKATPTKLAIEQIQVFLKTTQQWKAWASLYRFSHEMVRLPWMENSEAMGEQYLCPKFGWILVVANERIIAVCGKHKDQQQRIAALLPASQRTKGTKVVPAVSLLLQNKPASVAERCRFIREFLITQPEWALESLLGEELPEIAKAISLLLDAVLESVAKPIERATILRAFVSALPASVSHLPLPDGKKAAITGHVVDRLMTRFNVRSPVGCLRMLHKNAAKLHVVQLPVLIQVAHQVHHLTISTHWRFQNLWTLVEANGVIVTAYYPSKEKPAYSCRFPEQRIPKSVEFR